MCFPTTIRFGLVIACALLVCTTGLAQRTSLPLYPAGHASITATEAGDVPQLIVTTVDSDQPTAAVVILPGGGYGMHAIDHEGYQIADWFKSIGVSSAICTYRLRGQGNGGNGYGHPTPMHDAQRAIQTLRAGAASLNIDPNRIGVIGFSAGGHLASTVATHVVTAAQDAEDPVLRVGSRADFCILCYPVITMDADFTHAGSRNNLLGPTPDDELVRSLSNEQQVTPQTPPTFLFHTAQDKVVVVKNSLAFYQACADAGVPAELHVYAQGRHGVGLAADEPGADAWPALCEAWLKRIGVIGPH